MYLVPERVRLVAAVVKDAREERVHLRRRELGAVRLNKVHRGHFIKKLHDKLEIRVVTADADNRALVDLANALDIGVASQRAVAGAWRDSERREKRGKSGFAFTYVEPLLRCKTDKETHTHTHVPVSVMTITPSAYLMPSTDAPTTTGSLFCL